MVKTRLVLVVLLALIGGTWAAQIEAQQVQDVRSVLQAASKNLGADTLRTIQYTAGGMVAAIGQAYAPMDAGVGRPEGFPRFVVSNYTRTIDYGTMSSREEYTRQAPTYAKPFAGLTKGGAESGNESDPLGIRGGGNIILAVEPQPFNLVVSGNYAWNVQGAQQTPNRQFAYLAGVDTADMRQLEIILTPHGFLKAALAPSANPTLVRRGNQNHVTFTARGKYTVTGTIANNEVTVVRTWVPNPVTGDMLVETRYTEYKDFGGGVKFPTYLHSHHGDQQVLGSPAHDSSQYRVNNVVPNVSIPANAFAVPDAVQKATPPAVVAESQPLGPGVWLIGGGANSVLVEFRDFVAVVEAPGNDERSQAVIAEVKRLVPAKPIRFLVNTHAHWDHSGGLRGYVAEGATIVTHEGNIPFYETVMARSSWTVQPDTLAKLRSVIAVNSVFQGFTNRYLLTDRVWGSESAAGSKVLEIYQLPTTSSHNQFNTVVYLPAERILINADMANAPAPGAKPPATPPEGFGVLDTFIRQNGLNVARHVPIHGRAYMHEEFLNVVRGGRPASSASNTATGQP